MQRVAFFDVAGTIVRGNPWRHVLASDLLDRRQINLARLPITFWWVLKKIRLINDVRFRHQWLWVMAGLMRGKTQEELQRLFAQAVAQDAAENAFHEPVVAKVADHKANGETVVLVSGMFDTFIQAYAAHVGADYGIGTQLEFENGICTGRISGTTIAGSRKLDVIRAYLNAHDYDTDMAQHYAYADSLSDVSMLSAVGTATATYPDHALRSIAQEKTWAIIG